MVTYDEGPRITLQELNKFLEQNKQNIIKSINPDYKLISPTKKMGITGISLKIIGNTYATNLNPQYGGSKTIPTTQKMSMKELEELNYQNTLELFAYLDFVYKRSRLMIDLMQNFNSCPIESITNGIKYTIMFLQVGVFMATVDLLINFLKSTKISLPSGKVISKQ